jgi:dihydroxy-acid dehydratase
MRGSLVSREIIADSIECVMHAERFDAMVTNAGLRQVASGMLMAAARLNLPCRISSTADRSSRAITTAKCSTSCRSFEAVGAVRRGAITEDAVGPDRAQSVSDRGLVRRHVHANTMACGGRGAGHVVARQCVAAGSRSST